MAGHPDFRESGNILHNSRRVPQSVMSSGLGSIWPDDDTLVREIRASETGIAKVKTRTYVYAVSQNLEINGRSKQEEDPL